MIDPISLIQQQIRLEYTLDQDGFLVPFPGSSEQAFYIVYRHEGGYLSYFNHKLPSELRYCLTQLGESRAFEAPQEVEALMRTFLPARYEGRFVSETITHLPDPAEFLQVISQEGQFVIQVEDSVVCQAWSERSDEHCAEVAVETHLDHRRKGYARMAVAAWAHSVISSGRTAFYSYKAENDPSRALARSLGAVW